MQCYGFRHGETRGSSRSLWERIDERMRHVVLQRLHIRPSRIPAAGGVMLP
jgi:hypothetical protein